MTKPITAACIMLLQEEGKLTLDDPITKHLPEMSNLKLDDGRPVAITIRQLLNHTSGMGELGPQEIYTSLNLEQAAERYSQVRMLFEPGSKWQYCQTGINLLPKLGAASSIGQVLPSQRCW